MTEAKQKVEEGRRLARNAEELEKNGKHHASKTENLKAILSFNEAIRIDPTDYRSYLVRGQLRCRIFQFEKALVDAESALKLNPSELRAHFGKGMALLGLKQFDEAELCFMHMLECDPECPEALEAFNRINLYRLADLGYPVEECEAALDANFHIFEDALEYLQKNVASQKSAPKPPAFATEEQQNPTPSPKPTEQLADLDQSSDSAEPEMRTFQSNQTHLNQLTVLNVGCQDYVFPSFQARESSPDLDMCRLMPISSVSPSVPLSTGKDLSEIFQPIQNPFVKCGSLDTDSDATNPTWISKVTPEFALNTWKNTEDTPQLVQNGVHTALPKSAATNAHQSVTSAVQSQQVMAQPEDDLFQAPAQVAHILIESEAKAEAAESKMKHDAVAVSTTLVSKPLCSPTSKVVVVPMTNWWDREYLSDPKNPRGFKSISLMNVQGLTEDILYKMFGHCGKIISTRVMSEKSIAFVNFADSSGASNALETMSGCTNPCGDVMQIRYQDPDYQKAKREPTETQENGISAARPQSEASGSSEPTAIWIGNLCIEDEDDLMLMFESFGKILSKKYDDVRGYGIVQFWNGESAKKALETMNGKYTNGTRLEVRYKEPQVCRYFKSGTCPHAKCLYKH